MWLVLAKKGTSEPTRLRYDDALEEALAHGWIDGQVKRRDDATYRQRFTPRRRRSTWSHRNVALAERLAAEGRMHPAGAAEVARAKDDGRWPRPSAYGSIWTTSASGERSFVGGSLAGGPRWTSADHAFGRVEAEHGARPGPVERLGSAPVGREPARSRAEQDRVDRAGRRDAGPPRRCAGRRYEQRGRQHERRGAPELHRLLLAARPPRGAPASRGRARGTATAGSACGSAPSGPGRAAPRRRRRRRARRRTACASGAGGSRRRRPSAQTLPVMVQWPDPMAPQVEQLADDKVKLTVDVPARRRPPRRRARRDRPRARASASPASGRGRCRCRSWCSASGASASTTEAVESHIGGWFWSAATRARVNPVAQPEYEYELPTSDNEDWSFSATVAVQPKPEPADWTTLEVPKHEAEVPEEAVQAELEVLQRTVAELVAGRGPRRAGRRHGRHRPRRRGRLGAARLRRRARLRAARRGDRERHPRPLAGESREIAYELADGSRRSATVSAQGDSRSACCRRSTTSSRRPRPSSTRSPSCARTSRPGCARRSTTRSRALFRAAAVDELVKATNFDAAGPLVEAAHARAPDRARAQPAGARHRRRLLPAAHRPDARGARAAPARRGVAVGRARARARGGRRQARDRGDRRRDPRGAARGRRDRGGHRGVHRDRAAPTASATTSA